MCDFYALRTLNIVQTYNDGERSLRDFNKKDNVELIAAILITFVWSLKEAARRKSFCDLRGGETAQRFVPKLLLNETKQMCVYCVK